MVISRIYMRYRWKTLQTRPGVGTDRLSSWSRDPRQALLASSNLRNDLRILSYDFDGNFGAGGASSVSSSEQDMMNTSGCSAESSFV